MREILFRGRRTESEKWVEGGLIIYSDGDCFIARQSDNPNVVVQCAIDASTVGQYTGLKDKNGERIFEGDVVDILTENEEVGVIEWSDGGFIVRADGFCVDFLHNIDGKDVEVIDNIHDNPELIGGGGES